MRRRIASVWLPRFDADLAARRDPVWRDRPLAFYRETAGRLVLTAANAPAQAEGVAPGMVLADARALIADLATMADRPERRARARIALRRWLDRFTPLVAIDGEDGFFLEMTGAAHLFGGEQAFLGQAIRRLEGLGFAVRAALADSPGAAWALARYGRQATVAPPGGARKALAGLPVAALRLEPAVAARLKRLGIARIGDLADLPRAAVVRRFGLAAITRLDQALAVEREPISPTPLRPPLQVRRTFAEPVIARPGVEIALARLIDDLIAHLDRAMQGAVILTFTIERLDGVRQSLEGRAAEPTRDAARIARLFAEKLDTLDPGFGVEAASLAAPRTGPAAERQAHAFGPKAPPDALGRLIDTLGGRLGFQAVARFAPRADWRPDRSFALEPATVGSTTPAAWATSPRPPGPRPLLLLKRPTPVEVEAATSPLAPPTAVRRAGRWRALDHARGPERIAPQWHEADSDWPAGRDYWRAEETTGDRLWLYREGDRWFLHGFFP